MNKWLKKITGIFDLHGDKEQEHTTIENVKQEVEFKGTNIWLLAFAIFIASIGLNVNSTAVIIGAMLISPLMGPIVGAGLALGINDFALLKKSFVNLMLLTIISIGVSCIYFLTSPINDAQSELLARTNPTIYDVLIAFFGGMAGIIGSSRVKKGNVIPGVAIATALMPPLCTAGYGLATAQWGFLFGAFYLYLINCTFICIATFLIVKYLRFSSVTFIDTKQAVQIRRIISLVVLSMLIPAVYFAWQTVQKNKFQQQATRFILDNFQNKDYTLIYKKFKYFRTGSVIELAFLNKKFSNDEVAEYNRLFDKYYLPHTKINFLQDLNQLTSTDMKQVLDQINMEEIRIKELENKFSFYSHLSVNDNKQLLQEVRILDSNIVRLSTGYLTGAYLTDKNIIKTDSLFSVQVFTNKNFNVSKDYINQFTKLIKLRCRKDTIQVKFISE